MKRPHLGRGFVAGLAAGLIASWVMNRFQTFWSVVAPPPAEPAKGESEDDTTVKAAAAVSESLFRHSLSQREKRMAGPAVHYVFGTLVGGLYGAAAEKSPSVTAGDGFPFGAAFWLIADEAAVPLLRLSGPPNRYPVSVHLYALASHLVFGWTAEAVRRRVRRAL